MEGVTGVSHWEEVDHNKSAYIQFQKQMSLEVAAACEGAIAAGAKEILVKDAHYSGRNILPSYLPKKAKIIRGWSGHPYSMLQEINSRFDALMLVGYHARAGSGGSRRRLRRLRWRSKPTGRKFARMPCQLGVFTINCGSPMRCGLAAQDCTVLRR